MTPTEFYGQSVTLERPPGMTEEQCGPLPILRMDGTCISCWRMSWRERLKALVTGRVWLGVLSGNSQPPVYVAVDRPFSTQRGLWEFGRIAFLPMGALGRSAGLGLPRYIGDGWRQWFWRVYFRDKEPSWRDS